MLDENNIKDSSCSRTLKESVDFHSLDGENVNLVLVGAPKICKEYLALVSDLVRAFRNPKTRTSILKQLIKELLVLAELKVKIGIYGGS